MDFTRHSSYWQSGRNSPVKVNPELTPEKLTKASSLDMSFLQSARIIQNNLVYVINLPDSIADEALLRSSAYFGQYGTIVKCALNKAHQNHGGVSYGVYITFSHEEEAALCIKACNQFQIAGHTLNATYGTTKYCSFFLSNKSCPKPNCLFLHKLASHKNTMTRDLLPKQVQPENSLLDKLNILLTPSDYGFPHARIVRPRLGSHKIIIPERPAHRRFYSREIPQKSRYDFTEDSAEEPLVLPEYLKEINFLASPSKDCAELSSMHIEEIMSPDSPDKWAVDILDVQPRRLSDLTTNLPSDDDIHLVLKK